MSVHIAVLDTDVPAPAVYTARGLYSSQFRDLLQSAAARLSEAGRKITIFTSAYDVVGGTFPPLESLRTTKRPENHDNEVQTSNPLAQPIDGILITGAAAGAYDTAIHPWIKPLESWIQTVYTQYPHVKFFGSCFGHQIIAQALLSASAPQYTPGPAMKVELCPDGRETGLVAIDLSPEFAASFPEAVKKLPGAQKQMRLQEIHGDWVVPVAGPTAELPAGWVNVGSTEMCPVQGLYYPGRVLTYQGHFEFDVFVNRETCLAFGRRLKWSEEETAHYVGLIEGKGEDDSKVAAEVVAMFFGGLNA
ncbi:class I glutamine amidotransferase-like protein [Aspergillus pseudonomiae]|uniref:Class I glutamine amidotransferase-like protein n=1 Tax=Aspergillus pseudonomiae TaxID=1506151 RepID=A0A5N7DU53_9EURO|nr:class I glutamine amidotransferase-like protein [Aspergillus pseudonomiae]KAB8262631.1 class I glutamine amidotransferase-like protein [Aspergillus pseudonomiae]KAE8409549.1 class I glutamine amidotransferase-like protein [Aspergillus pseudonomiae]